MSAPRLSIPLVLEARARRPDGMGGQQSEWIERGTLWGALDAHAGREARGEIGAISVVTWRITLRGVPPGDPRRPQPGERLRLGTRLFRIEAVAEEGRAGHWLVCHAREEAGT